jgi:hypothetical protein
MEMKVRTGQSQPFCVYSRASDGVRDGPTGMYLLEIFFLSDMGCLRTLKHVIAHKRVAMLFPRALGCPHV